MITIIAKTPGLFDPLVLFRNYKLNMPVGLARVEVVKLVNGSNYLHDGGFSQGDQTAEVIVENLTRTQRLNLEAMIESRADVLFGTNSAQYSARVKNIGEPTQDQASIQLVIVSKDASIEDIIYPPDPAQASGYYTEYVHSSYWQSVTGFDGVKWTNSGTMDANTFWIDYYTPDKIKIEYTGGPMTKLFIYAGPNGSGTQYLTTEIDNPVSGTDYIADYAGSDEIKAVKFSITGTTYLSSLQLWNNQLPVPPAQTWTDYTSSTYWTASGGSSWDGSKWVIDAGGSDFFNIVGTWSDNLTPSKIRLTISGASGTISQDFTYSSVVACFATDYTSLEAMPMSYQFINRDPGFAGNLDSFSITSSLAESFNIDKIELLV